MKDNLDIDKLFKDKFESFEPAVNSQVWQNVASSVTASNAASAAGGMALWLKGIMFGAAATLVGGAAWFYFDGDVENNDISLQKNIALMPENEFQNKGVEEKTISVSYKDTKEMELVESKATEISTTEEIKDSDSEESVDKHIVDGLKADKTVINEGISSPNTIPNNDSDSKVGELITSNNTKQSDVLNDGSNHDESEVEVKQELEHVSAEKVAIVEEPKIEDKPVNLSPSFIDLVPNVITPNGDQINDKFFINTKELASFYIMIYTQGNVKVFESYESDFNWIGDDLGGNMVDKGKYYYLIKAVGKDGENYSIPGQIYVK
ncbi:MAG: gliding motility-associated C-terminal domain-containing protein [Crocinitomicaceae bacterium]